MGYTNKKLDLLGNAPLPKALLAMGLPTMIGMMVNALYNLVDAYFASGLGKTSMGAISVVFPIGQAVVGIGLLFGGGAAPYLSRLLGQGEPAKANKTAATALYSGLLIGAALILGCVLFLSPLLRLLGASESILPDAVTYARIYVLSCLFNIFNVTMNSIITSEGAAKTTMCALLAGAVLNIALDPVLIYALDFGVAGAALATALSQAVSASVYLCYIRRKISVFSFHRKDFSATQEILFEILKTGIPTLVFQLLTSLSIALINRQAKPYGDAAIAAMGAVTRVVSMGSLMVFGFLKGFQAIAGYSFGARKFQRLYGAIQISILWSTAFCALLGLAMALFSTGIISPFANGDSVMLQVGRKALRANGFSFLLFGFYTVYSFLFLALGKGREGFLLGAGRQGICFVPLILILPVPWGLDGIVYAQPIADGCAAILAAFLAVRLHRKLSAAES